MKLLDLFCGAGGCSRGYELAGFDVTGVDINPQPHYPYKFIRADALTFPLDGYDIVHASPPCPGYSPTRFLHKKAYPMLIEPTRQKLRASGLPYIIENVEGAPLENPIVLCGSMFGLCTENGWLRRHRLFECSFPVVQPKCGHPEGVRAMSVYGNTGSYADNVMLMDIDWMTQKELSQAIPPVYAHYIGGYARDTAPA